MQATVSQIWFVVHILVGTTFKIFIHVHLIFASVLKSVSYSVWLQI